MSSLANKRILIVGGGSGIGYAVAEACVGDGALVTIASTDEGRLAFAAERLGDGVASLRLDVTDEAAVKSVFENAPAFDHIVTTAGDWNGPRRVPLAELDLDAARGLFAVRFWGAVNLAKYGAPKLRPGGSLTLTDGMIAHKPAKGSSISTAMAGAVEHLARGLAVELAPIRVNAVCPGLILTDVWNSIPVERRAGQLEAMTRGQLIPRVGTPAEAAEAYVYLMRAGYTTGQVLRVEGGSALGS